MQPRPRPIPTLLSGLGLALLLLAFLASEVQPSPALAPRAHAAEPAPRVRLLDLQLHSPVGGIVNGLDRDGDRIYYTAGSTLVIVDGSDPERPRLISRTRSHPHEGVLEQVSVVDGIAYAARVGVGPGRSRANESIARFDVREPARPRRLAEIPLPASDLRFAVAPPYLYALVITGTFDPQHSLRVYDLRAAPRPALVSERSLPSRPWRLALSDDLLLIPCQDELCVYDLRDPAMPELAGALSLEGVEVRVHAPLDFRERRLALAVHARAGYEARIYDLGAGAQASLRATISFGEVQIHALRFAARDELWIKSDSGQGPSSPGRVQRYSLAGPDAPHLITSAAIEHNRDEDPLLWAPGEHSVWLASPLVGGVRQYGMSGDALERLPSAPEPPSISTCLAMAGGRLLAFGSMEARAGLLAAEPGRPNLRPLADKDYGRDHANLGSVVDGCALDGRIAALQRAGSLQPGAPPEDLPAIDLLDVRSPLLPTLGSIPYRIEDSQDFFAPRDLFLGAGTLFAQSQGLMAYDTGDPERQPARFAEIDDDDLLDVDGDLLASYSQRRERYSLLRYDSETASFETRVTRPLRAWVTRLELDFPYVWLGLTDGSLLLMELDPALTLPARQIPVAPEHGWSTIAADEGLLWLFSEETIQVVAAADVARDGTLEAALTLDQGIPLLDELDAYAHTAAAVGGGAAVSGHRFGIFPVTATRLVERSWAYLPRVLR